jgi:23S rRNA maturation mini-RNase III
MRSKIRYYIRVFWQGFTETKLKYQRYSKLCKERQAWLVTHLIVGPEARVSVDDQELQIRKSRINRYKREVPRVDQDSFRTQAAFSALIYVLFCCQVPIAGKLTSKTSP